MKSRFFLTIFLFCMAGYFSAAFAQTPYGTYMGTYNGVAAYSNGSGTFVGTDYNTSTGYNTGLKWQCVEYVNRYYYSVYGLSIRIAGQDAYQYHPNASSRGLTSFQNGGTSAPQVGDILCFNQTGAAPGHVAIIRSVDAANSVVHVIQQNVKNGGTSPNGYGTDEDFKFAYNTSGGSYTVDVISAGSSRLGSTHFCQGWIRKPSASVAPAITNFSPATPVGSNSAQPFTINGSNFVSGCNVTLRQGTSTYANRTQSSFSSSSITINPNFSTTAQAWTVEVINPDGQTTGQYSFNVGNGVTAPAITNVSPTTPVGSNSAQPFTINGSNFVSGCNVTLRVGGSTYANRTQSSFSSTSITINPLFGAVADTWTVEVINPSGQTTGQFTFNVTAPTVAPSISGVNPAAPVGSNSAQPFTINGSNFVSGCNVTLRQGGSTYANRTQSSFSSSSITINPIFSTTAQAWTVEVINPDGQTTGQYNFNVGASGSTLPLGIDVSKYQGTINWSQVNAGGKVFALVRATAGKNTTDEKFASNIVAARSAGVLVGAYHFAYPQYFTAHEEAQKFLSVAGAYVGAGYLPPALDIEDSGGTDNSFPYLMGKAALSQWIRDWCAEVELVAGVKPMIYSSRSYSRNYFESNLSQYPYWVATDSGAPDANPGDMGIWSTYLFQQYRLGGSGGTSAGITGAVDLNSFNGSLSALTALTNRTPISYTITPSAGTNGSISPSAAQVINSGGSVVFTATPVVNYVVDKWLLNGTVVQVGGNTYTAIEITSPSSLQVLFKGGAPVLYTLTPNAGANGSISPNTPQTTASGGSVTFTAIPVSSYVVDQWLLNNAVVQSGGNSYTATNVLVSASVQVTFKKIVYPVTPSAEANGSISPNTVQTVISGGSVTFTATPATNYVVDQWIENNLAVQNGGNNYVVSNVTGSKTLVVTFKPSVISYVVTPSADANGSISPNTVQTVNSGGSVTFAATPAANYVVDQWVENNLAVQTGGNNHTVSNVVGNKTVLVTFKPSAISYTVTPSADTNGSISPNVAQSVVSGGSVTFTASPLNGYLVNQWLVNNVVAQSGGATFNLMNVASDASLRVTFVQPPNAGVITFSTESLTVSENGVVAGLYILRTGGASGAVTVTATTESGSALSGSDFNGGPPPATVTFQDGETAQKFVGVEIIDDTAFESTESFRFIISTVTGGAAIGALNSTTITITDNDPVNDDHGNTIEMATPIGINSSTAGSIETVSDTDYFRIVLTETGTLTVQGSGTMDNFGYLFNAAGELLDTDDDDGINLNFLMTLPNAAPGTYYLRVEDFGQDGTGTYGVQVTFTPSGSAEIRAGIYTGIIQSSPYNQAMTGLLTAKVAASGQFTGKLALGAKRYSVKGAFSGNGHATVYVSRRGLNLLVLDLQMQSLGGNDTIVGHVFDGPTTSEVVADRLVWNKRTNPYFQGNGRYAGSIAPDSASVGEIPNRFGLAAVRVSTGGTAEFVGRLGDGTKISYAAPISKSNTWPLFKALYRGNAGALIGTGELNSGDWTGFFHWHRPADFRSRSYSAGFEGDLELSASPE